MNRAIALVDPTTDSILDPRSPVEIILRAEDQED